MLKFSLSTRGLPSLYLGRPNVLTCLVCSHSFWRHVTSVTSVVSLRTRPIGFQTEGLPTVFSLPKGMATGEANDNQWIYLLPLQHVLSKKAPDDTTCSASFQTCTNLAYGRVHRYLVVARLLSSERPELVLTTASRSDYGCIHFLRNHAGREDLLIGWKVGQRLY